MPDRDEDLKASESVASILEKPPSLVARSLFYVILGITVAGLVWASVCKIDVVIKATGSLVPYGLSKIVNAESAGVVKEIKVKESERVQEGQLLILLDTERSELAMKKIREQIKSQEENLRGATGEIEIAEAELERSNKEYRLQEQLAQEGLSPEVKTLESERKVDEAKNRLQQAKLKKITAEKTIQQLTQDLLTEKRNLASCCILAPVSGVVTELKVHGTQEYVQTGQVVATVAQEEVPLLAKIQVDNKDSGHLRLGLPVRLKMDAFPFQDYGTLPGKIMEISADARQAQGNDQKKGAAHFEAFVALQNTVLHFAGKNVEVRRGQSLTAEIIVDRIPLIYVILKPFRKLKAPITMSPD